MRSKSRLEENQLSNIILIIIHTYVCLDRFMVPYKYINAQTGETNYYSTAAETAAL